MKQSYAKFQMNLPMVSNGFKRYNLKPPHNWKANFLDELVMLVSLGFSPTPPLVLPPVRFAIPKHCGKRIGACPPSAESFAAVGAEKGPMRSEGYHLAPICLHFKWIMKNTEGLHLREGHAREKIQKHIDFRRL